MPKYHNFSDEYELSTFCLNKNKQIQLASFFFFGKSGFGFHPIRLFATSYKQAHDSCAAASVPSFKAWGVPAVFKLDWLLRRIFLMRSSEVQQTYDDSRSHMLPWVSASVQRSKKHSYKACRFHFNHYSAEYSTKKRNRLNIRPRSERLLFASTACNFQLCQQC